MAAYSLKVSAPFCGWRGRCEPRPLQQLRKAIRSDHCYRFLIHHRELSGPATAHTRVSMLMVSVLRMAGDPAPCMGRTECQELKVFTNTTA